RLALLPFLISCLIWLDLVASLPLIKERILVIILLLHFLSLMLGSVLVLMLPLLVWLTPRSEERFSRNAETDLVCRLLLEKKKKHVDELQYYVAQKQLRQRVNMKNCITGRVERMHKSQP